MNTTSVIFCLIEILILIIDVCSDCFDDSDIVEKLYWTSKNELTNTQWEFSIIGRRVPWSVGKMLCSSRNFGKAARNEGPIDDAFLPDIPTTVKSNWKNIGISGLAVLDGANVTMWLARKLSESNYQYDGLWIGGHRKNAENNWTWIESEGNNETPVASTSIASNYPKWYRTDKVPEDASKNCLIFERTGHNLPILVPTNCKKKKPFVCSRIVKKNLRPKIVQGESVIADGSRYTLFTVNEGDEMTLKANAGFRRLNGGGVTWIEARFECRKRGQYLATVLSNEAVKKIASVMLKSRPSIESVWLDAWSSHGTEWKWSSSGLTLSPSRSASSHYPPWLQGHPVPILNHEIHETNEGHSRCLVLDRHLCPQHMSPVFLDLDCEKSRPFVCQDGAGIFGRQSGPKITETLTSNSFSVDDHNFQFSSDRMTWNEAQVYCSKNTGKVASILDSKTLAMILERMADSYLDHVWVGGKTFETNEGWKWFDETGKPLKSEGIGMPCSWCFGNDDTVMLKAEPNSCLNLDREGHGLPLFYGLSCNSTRQHVLCGFDNVSRSDSDLRTSGSDRVSDDSKRTNFGSRSVTLSRKLKNETIELKPMKSDHTFLYTDANGRKINTILRAELGENDLSNRMTQFRLVRHDTTESNTTSVSSKNKTKDGTRAEDFDESTKTLLPTSSYNISGNDSALGL
ncbi:uncharacterized protein [Venturia canescens]|uniref:uncharacterized protein n=1 Tax=Venturia canescens TaxID=32260 RepID=UPI001C9C4627|nr:uncharacterized protein LOC122416034 [Venturia canescens]